MSFILDALRKSESERQQETRPNIARIPDAVPPRRLPAWAFGTIAALALGVVALAFAWWRTASEPSPVAAAARTVESPGSTALPIPPQSDAPPRSAAAAGAPPPGGAEAPLRVARTTLREAAAVERSSGGASGPGTGLARSAREPAHAVASLPAIDAQLPRYVAGADLPALRLELHAYDDSPSGRFVFINGSKYVEGDRLAEGPRLIAITADGAVLLAGGRQLLLRQE